MPLIIVSGRPCTGKTSFATKLVEYLIAKGNEKVILVNEESLKLSKKDGYQNSQREKDVRGALKSEVDHNLTTDKIVIVDSLNYIKGYRYELYCSARTVRTPHCAVWVGCEESTATHLNNQRLANGEDAYDPTIIDDIRRRFEAPNESNRWDNPLFRVKIIKQSVSSSADAVASEPSHAKPDETPSTSAAKTVTKPTKSSWKPKKKAGSGESAPSAEEVPKAEETVATALPATVFEELNTLSISGSTISNTDDMNLFVDYEDVLEKILEHITTASAPVPNSSTVAPQHAQADLLYELDRISAKILQLIMTHQAESLEGTPLKMVDYDRALTLHRHVSLAELQRYRGQFIKINGKQPPTTPKAIGASFVDFLATHLQ